MFGPAQSAVARAVADSVREGVIPEGEAENLLIVGVFIHWEAKDDKKIFDYNYEATKQVDRPRPRQPAQRERPSSVPRGAARHPFAGGVEVSWVSN